MTLADPSKQANPTEMDSPVENSSIDASVTPDASPVDDAPADDASADSASRGRFLIGSQRDPAAYRARTKRDWKPIDEDAEKKKAERKDRGTQEMRRPQPADSLVAPPVPVADASSLAPQADEPSVEPMPIVKRVVAPLASTILPPSGPVPRPSVRTTDHDVDAELSRLMNGASMDDLLGGSGKSEASQLEPESLQSGRVVAVRRDDVFVEFAGREQGIVSLRQFDVPPRPGAVIQVVVQRLNPEDGLYELTLPNKAVQVDDWSDLVEGSLIEVRVTGHNTGGLECEINHIRGFIPVSQIALYRVEDLVPYVDQRLVCIITEADPERRNLVLSRRAVLEREKEQARDQMLGSLRPGQICDGVVRKLMDFGAFVDIGNGVDGLVHISQLAWGRVKHPSDVLKEGQAIKVRIEKVDPATGKISLGYRDLSESPWTTATMKYPSKSVVRGIVTKLMDFGAFVELEPGVEGLVHVSELSHKRVWRPSDVVKEGQEVEVVVLSIDTESQRISLSMKACSASPEPAKKDGEDEALQVKPSKKSNKPTGPLQGGLGRQTGNPFGLKW